MPEALAYRTPVRFHKMPSTVCIVDDNVDIREVLARIVRAVGLEAEVYDSAEAFLRRSDGSKIDCMLLDVQLSGMSGLELLERLSAEGLPYPVFLISGRHDAKSLEHAKRIGATVVDKPFDARILGRNILAAVAAAPR
jgi:FixJ family two-component response regulator